MALRKAISVAGILLAFPGILAWGQSNDAQTALQQSLIGTFALTKTTADRSDIVTPGTVVVLQKDGLMMYATNSPLPPVNTYRNGKISQGMGGFGRDLGITMLSGGKATANDYAKQKYMTGQKLWVTEIAVSRDNVSFVLYSDPDPNNVRYYGQLNFPIAKGSVPSASDALKTISEAVTVQPGDNTAQQPAAAPAEAPAAPAMAPIAPPPPPSDAQAPATKTVTLGQTKDQVTAILGQPTRIAQLGAKEIDYYPDMKVIYTNGKVSDVE